MHAGDTGLITDPGRFYVLLGNLALMLQLLNLSPSAAIAEVHTPLSPGSAATAAATRRSLCPMARVAPAGHTWREAFAVMKTQHSREKIQYIRKIKKTLR